MVCRLYEKIKEKDRHINSIGKLNADLDRKYLIKVAELEQMRLDYLRVKR
jgi:hypothetical protein